jgi:predicted nucleic acid-binding protein
LKVIDTAVAVDHLRGREEAKRLLRDFVENDEPIAASEVMRFELLAGVRDDELEALEAFFAAFSWLPVDEAVARVAGVLARKFRKSHGGIDDVDCFVAATSLVFEADLVTTNVRHFPMLRKLRAPY